MTIGCESQQRIGASSIEFSGKVPIPCAIYRAAGWPVVWKGSYHVAR